MDSDKARPVVRLEAGGRLGDSGGALVVKGQLVGVMIATTQDDGLAVPSQIVLEFLEEQR